MSSLPSVPPELLPASRPTPRSRVLLIAHPDFAEPTASYLRRLECEVTTLSPPTAEACAALLFPPKQEAEAAGDRRWLFSRRQKHDATVVPQVGPPLFFAWSAFDAVVVQDLWPSAADGRLIPFGCMVVSDDYYARGNFHQPKVVLVTDPGFYRVSATNDRYDKLLHGAFDRNEQIYFVPVISDGSANSLARIGSALKRKNGTKRGERGKFAPDMSAPEQARALGVAKRALAEYVRSRARVVLVDDYAKTVTAVAAQFGKNIEVTEQRRVHLCDVTAGTVVSRMSFDELRRDCERLVDEARDSGDLLLVVTDILFDGVDWDGERKTGIDLIETLRASQRGRHAKLGIIGLTGVGSPLVMTSAFHRGADAIVTKSSSHGTALHHATGVNELVVYKLLLTMASHCFQHEFLYAKRHAPVSRARAESLAMRRILPSHSVSPHLQTEWEATQYLLEAQATYAQSASEPAERVISRIREHYD